MNEANKKFQKEINAGTAALVLLGVLAQADESMYGYKIAKMIETKGGDVRMMKQGALYPVLRSLENNGFLESRVDPSVSGPPRRYYSITKEGQKILRDWIKLWDQTKDFVDSVIKGNRND